MFSTETRRGQYSVLEGGFGVFGYYSVSEEEK